MKLTGLNIVGQTPPTRRIMVTLPTRLFEALSPYSENYERSGFIREAVRLLLAVTGEGDEIAAVADRLVTSCESQSDLDDLQFGMRQLVDELKERKTEEKKWD